MNFGKYYDVYYSGVIGLCTIVGANYGVLTSPSGSGIIGPALGAGAVGCIIGITSPIIVPVAILCSPSILYRMCQGKK
jgi:hypothetical protein